MTQPRIPRFDDAQVQALRSATAYDRAGEKIGSVGDVYLDDATGAPTWVTVHTGVFGSRVHVAPARDAVLDGDRLTLDVTRAMVLDAPAVEPDEHLGQLTESRLSAYYYHAGDDPEVPLHPATTSPDVAEQVGDVIRTDRPAGDFVHEGDLDTLHDDAGRIAPAAAGIETTAQQPFERATGATPDDIPPARPTA